MKGARHGLEPDTEAVEEDSWGSARAGEHLGRSTPNLKGPRKVRPEDVRTVHTDFEQEEHCSGSLPA